MGQASNVIPIIEPNKADMRMHLEHLFGGYLDGHHDGLIELSWTETKPDAKGRYRLTHARLFGTDDIDAVIEKASEVNAVPNCNVYVGAALRKATTFPGSRANDEDFLALTAAYVDLDAPGAAETAVKIYQDNKPTLAVVTGVTPHARAQLWWKLSEPIVEPERHRRLIQGITDTLQGDSQVTNPSRVMRLAGTIAWPVKPDRQLELTKIVPIKNPGQLAYLPEHLEQIFAASGGARPAITADRKTTSLGLGGEITDGRERYMRDTVLACFIEYIGTHGADPSAQELYDQAWPQYSRNVDFSRGGRGTEEMAEKCQYIVDRFAQGRLPGLRTLEDVVTVWQRKKAARTAVPPPRPAQASEPAKPSRFTFEKITDLRTLPPATWLVKDWIPEGGSGIFYGKWAAGKSFIGFDLALHLAYGLKQWHGVDLPAEPCDVLVIAREGHQGFVNRIDAFKKFRTIKDDTTRVTFMRGSVSFMKEDEFNALCEAIRLGATPYKLVIVDTVARVLPGVDMNEQQTVTMFMERIHTLGQVTGAATIGVHHQNKAGTMMGSTYFEANADFVFEISRDGEDDGPLSSGSILCTKMKDGEDRWKRSVTYQKLTLDNSVDPPSSLVVEAIGEHAVKKPPATKWPDKETCRRILNAAREAWLRGNPWSPFPQTDREGRYAPRAISREFDVDSKTADQMIREWQRTGVMVNEIRDKNSKVKGLKVVGNID